MRKAILLAVIFCMISEQASAQLSFKISKPLCLLTFLEAAAGNPRRSQTLRDYITKNVAPSDTAAFTHIIRRFAAINMDNNYVLQEYPQNRQKPRSSEDLIKMAAVRADDNDEFFQSITGILPNEQWLALKDIIQAAEPFYDKIIWNTQQEPLNKQLANLRRFTNSKEIFNKLKTFYGSTWSGDMPFTVGIYPIPASRGITTATPHNNSLVLAVLTGQEQTETQLGVVFHEISHVLYEEQPLAMQHQLDTVFMSSKSLYSQYAYSYLDEALATACGNGWAQEFLSGVPDTGSWYNDNYIDKYAHALHPMVKEYITAGKMMDEKFITRAIAAFEKEFPDAAYDYDNLMNRISLYTDANDDQQFQRIATLLNSHYRISSSYSSSPVTDEQSLRMAANNPGTQVFIIHMQHLENLKALRQIFPELTNISFTKESLISFIDKNNRPVVIVNVKDEKRVAEGLKKMTRFKTMDVKQPVRSID